MRILSVVGARPHFVKAFPLSQAIRKRHDQVLVHTGQHYDEKLSDVFFEELAIPLPDHHLGVGSAGHAEQTAAMMTGIEDLVVEESPDVVLVYGDTNSTLAGALVAAKADATLAHVEAGLRSNNWNMPEEVNRVITDHCSDLLFAPTDQAEANLNAEGLYDGVHLTGDVMYDAILAAKDLAVARSQILDELGLTEGEYVLSTIHRAGNTDDPDRLEAILDALIDIPKPVVFPVHPRTEAALREYELWGRAMARLMVIEPLGYLDFVGLLAKAERVATDSGGVQKEAFYLGRPCVTMREETEWVELVECGWNQLVGADPDMIRAALNDPIAQRPRPSLYGDGNAAEKIVAALDDLSQSQPIAADD